MIGSSELGDPVCTMVSGTIGRTMSDQTDDEPNDRIDELTTLVCQFAEDRDWQQFHTPRNLCLALSGEVGELAAELQWLSDDDVRAGLSSGELRGRLEEEIADVAIYLLRLSDVMDIDLARAIRRKVDSNARRYTIDRSRGNARKQ